MPEARVRTLMAIEALCRDPRERRVVLKAMADGIWLANSVRRDAWSLTLSPGRLARLNVGPIEALTIRLGSIHLSLSRDRIPVRTLRQLDEWTAEARPGVGRRRGGSDFRAVPGVTGKAIPTARFGSLYPSLRPAFEAAIGRSALRRTPFHRSHSPELLDYLRAAVLPAPVYDVQGLDAERVLGEMVGRTIPTLTGAPNTVQAIEGSQVRVGTRRSPHGELVPIEWVQTAMDRLLADGWVEISVPSLGYRSAFVGAILLALPGTQRVMKPPGVILEGGR